MANYEVIEHKSVRIGLGENEFRTGVLTVAGNTTVKAGTIVQTVEGKFVASAGGSNEVGMGVLVDDVINSGNSSADIPLRVLISGRVNSKALLVGSSAATAVQADSLRNWSIVAVPVTEMN
ncbi:MAG: hypothetical protein MJZ37_07465 [Bacilli bacterium]|nr:hypothetical protein [Bacilli bacterium]